MKFSPRMDGIEISMIRQILSQAQGCVNLGLGEPGFPFPEVVLDEAHQILDEGRSPGRPRGSHAMSVSIRRIFEEIGEAHPGLYREAILS